jgi:hypothetical protein
VKLVEGPGDANDKLAFDAFAVLSPRVEADSYDFRSYTNGRADTFIAKLTAPGVVVWEIPQARIRYTITVQDGRWREIGERTGADGSTVLFSR